MVAAGRAATGAGWDLEDYGEPLVRRLVPPETDFHQPKPEAESRPSPESIWVPPPRLAITWEVIYLPKAGGPPRPQVNVWLDESAEQTTVSPICWPAETPVTEEAFVAQADRIAAAKGWPLGHYVKGRLCDHGTVWSVLYKGRSGLPGDHFSVDLNHRFGALTVRGGY